MNLLSKVLRDPQRIRDWGVQEWNHFLPLMRRARLLGRCLRLFEEHGLIVEVPQRIQDQMRGALAQTLYVQGQALRELRQVHKVLAREHIPVMALKGVAYLVAELPPSGWRNLADIDLMVPKKDVEQAEDALLSAGWQPSGDFDDYDRHYYREWMHEVPPLKHSMREIEVDLHHNLAPPVSRIRIEADALWETARSVTAVKGGELWVLAPTDLLLHNAVHLFMNDELRGGLRDVVDFCDLYRHFVAEQPGFDEQLLLRARELNCGRPLYYAAITGQRLAGLVLSDEFLRALRPYAPSFPLASLMHGLIERVLAPERLGMTSTAIANWLLFVRSHWVRMPFGMLIRHLSYKALVSKKPATLDADLPG